jgi:hypothetical protein
MKQHGHHVTRTQKEAERLQVEISNLETDLRASGSAKTADEVQAELDGIAADMYVFRRSAFPIPHAECLCIPVDARTTKRKGFSRLSENDKMPHRGLTKKISMIWRNVK